MAEVVVVAQIKAKPGQEAAVEQALKDAIEPTHAEPGCILYALHRGLDNPDTFYFLERWRTRKDLEEHLQTPHLRILGDKLEQLVARPVWIEVMEALPDGQPGKGTI